MTWFVCKHVGKVKKDKGGHQVLRQWQRRVHTDVCKARARGDWRLPESRAHHGDLYEECLGCTKWREHDPDSHVIRLSFKGKESYGESREEKSEGYAGGASSKRKRETGRGP